MIGFDFLDHSGEFLAALNAERKNILEEWGLHGERRAKETITKVVYDTPQSPSYKRTGLLRNSISHERAIKKVYIGTLREAKDDANVGGIVEYAPFVECGTSKMRARPFLRPAIEDYIDEYKEIYKKHLTGFY